MSPFEIRIALLREGVSMRSIARKLGVSPNSVSLVVNRRMVSRESCPKLRSQSNRN